MNPKPNKQEQHLRPGNAALDGGIIYTPNDERSWLEVTVEENIKMQQGQERAFAAEVFLKTRLLPLEETLNETNVVDLLVDFKRTRADVSNEFEMAHINARLLNRFQYYLLDDPDAAIDPQSDTLQRELELFTALAELDFQSIDAAVRERLQSD